LHVREGTHSYQAIKCLISYPACLWQSELWVVERISNALTMRSTWGACFKTLPEVLPEPLIYMSCEQRKVVGKYKDLKDLELPCWVPHRRIAHALGHDDSGIQLAMRSLGDKPYVWGTEFENVHSLWRFREPEFKIDGKRYPNSEEYFHSQKPSPFNAALWDTQRVDVMRKGVRAKFAASEDLRDLLISTHPHPLLSVKADAFWGFDPRNGGENMLAKLEMELRDELAGSSLDAEADKLEKLEVEDD